MILIEVKIIIQGDKSPAISDTPGKIVTGIYNVLTIASYFLNQAMQEMHVGSQGNCAIGKNTILPLPQAGEGLFLSFDT